MQNSIWKLVSLAGVVGVCFLLVLMAQNGLKQDSEPIAATPAPETGEASSSAGAVADLGEPATGDIEWPEQTIGDIQWEPDQTQSEPPVNTEPEIAAEPEIADPLMADIGAPAFTPSADTGNANAETDLTADFDRQATAFPELPEFDPSSLPALDPVSAEPTASFDPVGSGAEPLAAPPAELPVLAESETDEGLDLRALALELMKKSYLAIDQTDLLLAREKAAAAADLPVTWGPLEESPTMLLARIDGMLQASTPAADSTTAEPEPFPGDILPVSGEEPVTPDLPSLDLAADGGPDPFADTLPESPTALPTIDLPALDEAAPAFEPFAENLPEPEQPASLPALNDPISDPFPVIEQPELVSAPVEPEPSVATAEPARLASPEALTEPARQPELIPEAVSNEPDTNSATAEKPDVTIRKVAPAEATIGDPLIYSIEISNNGESNASEVVVEDRIPTGCRLVGTIPQAELIGSKILWRLGRLPAKSDRKLLIKVVPLEEGEIGSVATVNFVAEVSASTSVRQAAKPQIRLEVTNRETAKVGENVLFRFRVANDGSADAQNVSLQDIVPVGFEHPAGKDVTYEIGALPAGKAVDIDLELKAVQPGQHINRAIVKAGKDAQVEKAAAVEIVDDKGLTIKTPASQPQSVGQKTSHEIQVTNESSQPISGAAINVILPQELKFVSASDQGTFTEASNSIRWDLPVLQPGETVVRSTTVIPKTYGVHSSRVQLIQPDQPMETSDSLVEANGVAALRLTLENAPATVFPGEDFTVEFSMVNRGNGPDSNVQFSLVLPTGVDFVTARGPVRNLPPRPAEGGKTVSFTPIPEIGEGASVDFQVTLRSRDAGQPKIRAEVTSDQLRNTIATEAAIEILEDSP